MSHREKKQTTTKTKEIFLRAHLPHFVAKSVSAANPGWQSKQCVNAVALANLPAKHPMQVSCVVCG